jgi:hypothetical protein
LPKVKEPIESSDEDDYSLDSYDDEPEPSKKVKIEGP